MQANQQGRTKFEKKLRNNERFRIFKTKKKLLTTIHVDFLTKSKNRKLKTTK